MTRERKGEKGFTDHVSSLLYADVGVQTCTSPSLSNCHGLMRDGVTSTKGKLAFLAEAQGMQISLHTRLFSRT